MTSALDVGQFIYDELGWVDSVKLQKLVYYCEAWHLAWFGSPLTDEEFEAWINGPVAPTLYRANRYEKNDHRSTCLPGADPARVPAESREALRSVLRHYSSKSSAELIDQTHQELPWIKAREGTGMDARSRERISKLDMKRFHVKAEALGGDTPTRPLAAEREFSGTTQRRQFKRNVNRWSEALDLLADC